MSCEESDSEEFYDAEDETPDRSSRRGSKRSIVLSTETSEGDDDNVDDDIVGDDDVNELERRLAELERRTQDIKHEDNDGLLEKERKLKEVQQIVNADATPVVSSPYITAERPRATGVASNAASFDDIKKKLDYGIGETDPRIIIEDFGSAATRTDSPVEGQGAVCTVTCAPEPDIVQSTKLSKSQPARLSPPISPPPEPGAAAPVAPPRHRKKIHPVVPKVPISINTSSSTPTPVRKPSSPTVSFDVALDLNVAASGSRVVESKDDLCDRAEKTEAELRPVLLDPDLVSHASQDTSDTLSQGSDVINTRPRSNSGRLLSDKEILDLVSVKNLDTGEGFVLSEADDKIPQCANPIDFQIMTRTKEHSSSEGSLPRDKDHQTKDDMEIVTTVQKSRRRKTVQKIRHKGAKFKRYLGKKVTKMKNAADEMLKIDETSSDDDLDARRPYKYKASRSQTGPYEFEFLKPCQELKGQNMGAAWVMKFSPCGQLLAVGGQDNILRIWVLKDAYTTFDNLRQQYAEVKVSPSPSSESLNSLDRDAVADSASIFSSQTTNTVDTQCAEAAASAGGTLDSDEQLVYKNSPFVKKPFCMYRGHTADLLDVSWSKNYFILSSSMDKTVRLWHISRKECLCCFQHIDFVTAIAFHPRDERYFLSGSLDGKLRLWNIPDKKVELWNEISGHSKLITAANFCMNGKLAVVGTYDGHCLFYHTEQLKFHTGSKVGSKGRKITGIEPHLTEDKMLVTSNDSRLYLYDLRDLTLVCKYKGGSNCSSQIKASFSSDGKYIICGSEDQFVRIWKTFNDLHMFSSGRRDRNKHWEGIRAHNTVVTAAIFAPNPNLIIKSKSSSTSDEPSEKRRTIDHLGEVVVSADFNGIIKVFKNRFRQKVPKQ